MSLIKTKTGFNGLCDVKHEIYRPFYNAKAFLNKPLTPYGQAAEAQNVPKNVEIHASDDENANVGNMGYANVDEDAYAMPPPLLRFIPCNHSGSLLLDTLILILLIFNTP
jgi:hypothetical protein